MMSTPESLKKTKETKEKTKTGKSGLRGVPHQDKVNDKSIFVDPGNRKGHTKIDSDTIRVLDKAAKEMKMGKATLVREALHSFCMYYMEAKEIGGVPFFHSPKTYEVWLQERVEVRKLLNEIVKMNNTMQQNSQSSEVKMLSQMIVALTKMMNFTHNKLL